MEEKGNEAEEEMQLQQTTMPTTLPRLNEDLIYLVIEKMFFAVGREGNRRTEMDLRAPDNAYTRFMCLNRCHFNAMLAQFAKMKRIDFYTDFDSGEMGVSFYRNQEDYNKKDEDEGIFSGPYQVTGHLVSRLIYYGKLRPVYLNTDFFLTNKEPIKMSDLKGKKPLEVFSMLFLNKMIEVPDSHDLQIGKLVLDEKPEEIDRHFEAILALNSEEINLSTHEFPLSKTTIFNCKFDDSITYHKTKKITFYRNVRAYEPKKELALLAKTWTGRLIPFLAKVCPNLSLLEYKVNANFWTKASIANDFVDGLTHLVEAIQDMLMLISELADGSPQLSIRLKLCLEIEVGNYQRLPLKSHELFQLGTAVTLENVDTRSRYTARAIKMADKLGREHEFVFEIFGDLWLTESDDSDDSPANDSDNSPAGDSDESADSSDPS